MFSHRFETMIKDVLIYTYGLQDQLKRLKEMCFKLRMQNKDLKEDNQYLQEDNQYLQETVALLRKENQLLGQSLMAYRVSDAEVAYNRWQAFNAMKPNK